VSNEHRSIEQKVARSSLGTPAAVAARRSISAARASQVVARSKALRQAAESSAKSVGGKR
jgi:hypothetical protein